MKSSRKTRLKSLTPRIAITVFAGLVAMTTMGLAANLISNRYSLPSSANLDEVEARVLPSLSAQFSQKGLKLGDPIFIRIFKEDSELELWVQNANGYELFKTYPICAYSGDLGPKLTEGDGQSPEGFYKVSPSQMNPKSSYHLSFNLGFPNTFDRALDRTGSFLMVHGNCVSIGCYAMTNSGIEEIYLAANAAFKSGHDSFAVHSLPFRMTEENMKRHGASEWAAFWENLREGFDAFEKTRIPPVIQTEGARYVAVESIGISNRNKAPKSKPEP